MYASLFILAKAQVILVIFHHRAHHNSKITNPTKNLNVQSLGVVDAVFWQGSMYDCDVNQKAVTRVQELLRWTISLQSVTELKQILKS